MADMLLEALTYARRGWYVFPCREKPGASYIKNGETIVPSEKQPYVAHGLDDSTLDEEQITAWWTKFPNALIGINAGKSGLFVIDIDKKHINGLDTFVTWNINDSAGLHSMTPSGGMHILFSGNGKSSTNAKTGIDTRGEGGYFIAPPSKILEGKFIGEYKRFDDWSRTPGVIPDGLMSKLFPDNTTEYVRGSSSGASDGNIKQLSRASLTFLANGAPDGERNSTLFRVLADFCGCGYSRERAKETVWPVCSRIGLTVSEFEQVLNHAYSKPRTSSIPDSIQEEIASGKKDIASKLTPEEQTAIENTLLACLIGDNKLIPAIQDILRYEDFTSLRNRVIYKSIIAVYNSGMKVDYLTVSDEVSRETDKVSIDDISNLINQYFINSDNCVSYAYIIKEKSSIRKLEAILDNKEKYIKSGNFNETISKLEEDISNVAIYGGAKTSNVLNSGQAAESFEERRVRLASGELTQLETGFIEYDKRIGGIYSDELVICAARSGDGKSALALTVANNVAVKQDKGVLFFSLEMSTNETIARLVCQLTGLKFKDIIRGRLDEKEFAIYKEALDRISTSKLYIDDSPGIGIRELRSKIRKFGTGEINLIIIDQLEQLYGYEGQQMFIRLDRLSYDIKALTKEFGIPIILNHQLNRAITDRKLKNPEPQLSDLAQAGEKAPNQVWGIVHKRNEQGEILSSKIKLLKNRNGGCIQFPVKFIGERFLFANTTKDEDNDFYEQTNQEEESEDYSYDENVPSFAR